MKKQLHTLLVVILSVSASYAQTFNNTYTISDIAANKGTGKFTFFSFTTGEEVVVEDSATTNWDIAFSGTTVILNGGTKGPSTVAAQFVTPSTFLEITEAPTTGYSLYNISGSGSWYNYYPGANNSGPHTIVAIDNKMIVVKLANERYVKFQMLNYYQGAPNDVPIAGTPYTGVGKYLSFRYTMSDEKNMFNDMKIVKDFAAIRGANKYSFFNFTTGAEVSVEDSATVTWDIAFSGTTVIFNGGTKGPSTVTAQFITSTYDDIIEAPTTGYSLNILSGSGSWYTYYPGSDFSGPHTILPIEDKLILVKLASGRFVKLQLLSYYQGAPSDVPTTGAPYEGVGKYYAFRYILSENIEEDPIPTSLLAINSKKTISIYPNPISAEKAELTIDSDIQTGTVKIMDLLGNLVYTTKLNHSNTQLKQLNLSQGVYVLVLESEGTFYQQKLIVQ